MGRVHRCEHLPRRVQGLSQLSSLSLSVRPPGGFLSRYAGRPHDVGNDRTGHRPGPEGAPQGLARSQGRPLRRRTRSPSGGGQLGGSKGVQNPWDPPVGFGRALAPMGLRRSDPGEMGWSSRVSSALTVRHRRYMRRRANSAISRQRAQQIPFKSPANPPSYPPPAPKAAHTRRKHQARAACGRRSADARALPGRRPSRVRRG